MALVIANREMLIFVRFRNLGCAGRFRNVRWRRWLHGIAAGLAQRNISVTGLQGDFSSPAGAIFTLQVIIP